MKRIIKLLICLGLSLPGIAQNVGIGTNTPNASALLDLQSANKGLLLPRVADTTVIASPARGLIVFSNATNSLWFYNGRYWQLPNDNVWQAPNDSVASTGRKYISINPYVEVESPPLEGLTIDGSLLMKQKVTTTKVLPGAAQTLTMTNSSLWNTWLWSDSTGRFFDPGGANSNYNNNMQGNILITGAFSINVAFNPADFGISAGDTLWIGPYSFPECRTNYTKRFTNINIAPPSFNITPNVFFVFRSNGDNINSKGFDITFKRLYPVTSINEFVTPGGIGLFFENTNGALRTGNMNPVNIGRLSAAFGDFNTASGFAATAFGRSNSASGDGATAMGIYTNASGNYSTSMGYGATASGGASTAMGEYTSAMGGYSVAMGTRTIAKSFNSLAIGSFNDTLTGSSENTWVATDPLFYVGNSNVGSQRSNAMVIYKNANVDINGYSRLGKLSEGAPVIKMKELSGTTSSINNGSVSITHGLNSAKIISVQALVEYSTGNFVPTAYTYAPELHFNYLVQTGSILVVNNASTCTGTSICNKPVKILITYKE